MRADARPAPLFTSRSRALSGGRLAAVNEYTLINGLMVIDRNFM